MASIAEEPNLEITAESVEWKAAQDSNAPFLDRFERIATFIEAAGDLAAAMLGITGSYHLYKVLNLGKQVTYPTSHLVLAGLLYAALFVMLLDREGAYRQGHGLLRIKETERALRVAAQSFLLVLPISFFAAQLVSRWVFGIATIFVPLAVILVKHSIFLATRGLHGMGLGVRRVVIYGAGFTGRRIFSALTRSPKLGLLPVAIIDDAPEMAGQVIHGFGYRREYSVEVHVKPITSELFRTFGAELVIVAIPTIERKKLNQVFSAAVDAGAKFACIPGHSISSELWVEYADIDGLMLASFSRPAKHILYEMTKRVFDFVAASAILLLTSPILLAAALAVRWDSAGPVIFTQKRVGKDGRLFSMYKFRSMKLDAPKYEVSPLTTEDPRITKVGKYLRKASLDELPQLFNVLKGEMSLVGPRPEMPFVVETYGSRERQRLSIVPGITGLWQLSADRAFPIHESIHYDLYYIRQRGFFMDLAILFHTVLFAMKGI